ncbi:MAG: S-layer homology domain-containing protein, partial [Egibacteraceae bacterium]
PQQPVTRGQMATFLDRALELVPDQAGAVLSDVVGNAHADAIDAVVGAGIAQGFTDGTFRPQQPVTRGQMATFLDRALDL